MCSITAYQHYDRCMAKAFAGLSGFCRIDDDIIIYDSDATQHAYHAFSKGVQTNRLRLI